MDINRIRKLAGLPQRLDESGHQATMSHLDLEDLAVQLLDQAESEYQAADSYGAADEFDMEVLIDQFSHKYRMTPEQRHRFADMVYQKQQELQYPEDRVQLESEYDDPFWGDEFEEPATNICPNCEGSGCEACNWEGEIFESDDLAQLRNQSTTDQPDLALLTAYIKALSAFDYYYQYSDDHRVWTRGDRQATSIRDMKDQLNARHDGLGDNIWEDYVSYMDKGGSFPQVEDYVHLLKNPKEISEPKPRSTSGPDLRRPYPGGYQASSVADAADRMDQIFNRSRR